MGFWRQILVLWGAPDWKAKAREPFWVRYKGLVPAIFNAERNTLLEYEKYSLQKQRNKLTCKFGGAPDQKGKASRLATQPFSVQPKRLSWPIFNAGIVKSLNQTWRAAWAFSKLFSGKTNICTVMFFLAFKPLFSSLKILKRRLVFNQV